jgi:predicted nuclease with TOPRIM domain
MIQQQVLRNLEALKASLPDLTPEVDKLAKEHAQLKPRRDRLQRENTTLRQQLQQPPQPGAR